MFYITYDEYYNMCSKLEKLPKCDYIPSDCDLDFMTDYYKDSFEYIVYIVEYHTPVQNSDLYATNQLKKAGDILYDNLTLTDSNIPTDN